MKEKELRRSLSVLPIGTVMKLTGLSARQIRYYEQKNLLAPKRSKGNRRLYSLNDVDRILDIKDYLNAGLKIAEIKHIYDKKRKQAAKQNHRMSGQISDNEARQLLKNELLNIGHLQSDFPDHHNYPV
ncbi:MerR family transcriptional regulator [Acetilactobacillus jinshanensis]|uniref:MerR family transcriptional regulator n=1 Tax=Acetilactobacillus jinshanensis TaxID=1720083 RepID=A0A4P6ZLL2_9LACO|nr:MerR family transcriptional regulator [Acetilactobacillus jinshanensis]QBP18292.1 MerR family transcriptional regulator [Acetilactobacillus jinshanensis]URL61156.1 MerR family transcriptional regulator [uncultured bacterium]